MWKIREAASRALLTLLSQSELTRCIELLYSNGLGIEGARQNHTHGLLLMLNAILLDMFPTDWETGITAINLLYDISWIGKQYVARCNYAKYLYCNFLIVGVTNVLLLEAFTYRYWEYFMINYIRWLPLEAIGSSIIM